MLADLFRGYDGPPFSIRVWNGWSWSFREQEVPVFSLVFEVPGALDALVIEPSELTLGEAFVRGDISIRGDIFAAFSLAEHVFNRPRAFRQRLLENFARTFLSLRQWIGRGSRHSLGRDRSSISIHYDQPLESFRPWLGRTMAYSCAYFRTPDDTLDAAQTQKLDLVCQKLRLQPLNSVLDIGCGWGSLVLFAAENYQVEALGITLSCCQANVAKERIEQERLGQSCTVALRDYRDQASLPTRFDKIASIGMFEHVGLRGLPRYFEIAHRLLKPGGVFLNHGIARSQGSPPRKASFIDKHVFPDSELVTLSEAIRAAECAGFEVRDVENLREHYELTLRHWVHGLERDAAAVLKHVSESTYRTWLLYMAGSAAAFRRGDLGVYQLLLSRPDRGDSRLPLTREAWYSHGSCERNVLPSRQRELIGDR
ncbi:cyclopropane-fatty-acyl-phospholipid synthase family protein [Granulicella sp. 5B5]|uniref:SAM-dependent methyltransferase n=1 Tax=Granulicella sp. 5B5 TaxID=1617967 RepID=UPI0015F3744A|nr:cyclopropane-fatty-acyl-phospholipid synthase family protein [Granulicella sp. 5B5]